MKAGEPIRAELIYPVYDHDHLVLPAGTTVAGTVVALTPDHTRRIHARLTAPTSLPFTSPSSASTRSSSPTALIFR